MQKLNWIILASNDRGTNYGVGSFIKQLSQGLAHKNVNVYVIEIGITNSKFFNIRRQDQVTIFEVPVKANRDGIDTRKNQEKIAQNIALVVSQYIPSGIGTVIHMNYLFQYYIATSLKEKLNAKIVFTQHVFTTDQRTNENYFDVEFQTYRSVDKIVTVTRHGKEHLIEKNVSPEKIEVILNGINPNLFTNNNNNRIKEKYGITGDEKMILYSGRIDPIKGLDYLCQAMESLLQKYSNCRLVIAGDGDLKSLNKATLNFSQKFTCLGFIPFEDVVALYHEADIGVIPSLEEHCSYVALEMLHCGLPVVVTKVGGLNEIFVHGENALLVETIPDFSNVFGIAPDATQMGEYMITLLKDEDLRKIFSQNAQTRAVSIFTSDIMAYNYLQIISNLN